MLLGLRIVGEFGAIIAVPVVLLSMLGKYLDGKYGTAPWLLIAGFVLAFALSAFTLYRRAKRFRDEYLAIDPEGFAGTGDRNNEEATVDGGVAEDDTQQLNNSNTQQLR